MQNVTQSKKTVHTLAYVLLGITIFWYAVTFGVDFMPVTRCYWDVFCSLVPYVNLVFALVLWASYYKAGRSNTILVRATLLMAVSPLALHLWFRFRPGWVLF